MINEELFREYQEYILNYNNKELLLYSKNDYYYEYDKKEIRVRFNEENGVGVREFNSNGVIFEAYDGFSISNLLNKKPRNRCELPFSNIVDSAACSRNINFEDINKMRIGYDEELTASDFAYQIIDKEKTRKSRVCKILYQYQQENCILINSKGVAGYYMKKLFSPSIIFEGKLIYDIYPEFDKEKWYNIWELNCNKSLEVHAFQSKIEYILLTPNVFGQIIYFLILGLQYNLVKLGKSKYKLDDIGKKMFSNAITMEENSNDNHSLEGNCDGVGLKRIPQKIVKDGVITDFISSMVDGIDGSGSSAYRLSYKQPPITKASKVSVLSNISKKEFQKNYVDYLEITSLFGINESYNIANAQFSSNGDGIVYKNGKPIYRVEFNFIASVEDILKEVICVLDEKKYVADGSIITGAALVENKGFVC